MKRKKKRKDDVTLRRGTFFLFCFFKRAQKWKQKEKKQKTKGFIVLIIV